LATVKLLGRNKTTQNIKILSDRAVEKGKCALKVGQLKFQPHRKKEKKTKSKWVSRMGLLWFESVNLMIL